MNIKTNILKYLILLVTVLLFVGCSNYRENYKDYLDAKTTLVQEQNAEREKKRLETKENTDAIIGLGQSCTTDNCKQSIAMQAMFVGIVDKITSIQQGQQNNIDIQAPIQEKSIVEKVFDGAIGLAPYAGQVVGQFVSKSINESNNNRQLGIIEVFGGAITDVSNANVAGSASFANFVNNQPPTSVTNIEGGQTTVGGNLGDTAGGHQVGGNFGDTAGGSQVAGNQRNDSDGPFENTGNTTTVPVDDPTPPIAPFPTVGPIRSGSGS